MTAPKEPDDMLLAAIESGRVDAGSLDPSLAKALAAHEKVEALFELLRRPAQEKHDAAMLKASVGTPSSSGFRFRILRPHAKGGLGEVFVAHDEELHREVALKEIQDRFADDPESRSRFVLEAEITGGLEHPGIVPVYGLGQYPDGRPFYAMRFIRGDSLKDAIDRYHQAEVPGRDAGERTLALRSLLGRFLDVCNAVAYAHSRGVLHRDLKPGNIMLGQYGETLVVDWGLSKPLDRLEGATRGGESPLKPASGSGVTPTQAGSTLGTPQYMSPEQAAGRLDLLGTATDVYSLGATLYSLLTGKPPFGDRDLGMVLHKVQKGDFIPPRKVNPAVPPALEAISLKAMELAPQDRYTSPRAMADDIEHWLADEPVSAWREPWTIRVRRWVRRHRTKVAATSAAVLVATVSFAIGTILLTAAYERERKVKERERAAKELTLRQEEQAQFVHDVNVGDAALFRCLTGQRPTWLPSAIETHRQEGIDAYNAALKINPIAVWPLVQRGRLHAAKKESLELALADFDKANNVRPKYASIQKFRGQVLKRLGRKEEAEAAVEKARNLYPTTTDDLYWLGNIAHSNEQDLAAAHSYFSQALLLSPDHYWSRLERAEWGQLAGGPSEVDSRRRIAEFTTAKVLRPDLPFASESLLRWQKTVNITSKQDLQHQIDQFGMDILRAHDMAEILESEGKFDEAETLLRKVLDQDTGGWTAEMLAKLKHRLGKYTEAIEWYQRAIKEGKKDASLYFQLANVFTILQDFQAAEQTYRRGIAEDPNNPMLFYQLANWYEARRKLPEAEATYKMGCQLPVRFKKSSDADSQPETVDNTGTLKLCFQEYALFLEKLGRNQEMILLLERAIERIEKVHAANSQSAKGIARAFPDVGFLKDLLGQQYIYAGRRQDVLSLIDAELKIKPLTVDRAVMVTSLLQLLGMKEQALDVARNAEYAEYAVSDNKLRRKAASNTVEGQLQSAGRYKELVDRIETRRAFGDSLSEVDYTVLGLRYMPNQALEILKEAIARHPRSYKIQTEYMTLLAKQGSKADARKAYKAARDLFFETVASSSNPAPPSLEGNQFQSRHPWPSVDAMPWFSYLVEEGSLEELSDLEGRLQEASIKLGRNPDELLLARAKAEVNSGRYSDAVKSLRACLKLKQGNEAWVVPMLAHSLLSLDKRQEGLQWLRQAVELTDFDARNVSRFLMLLVEEEGVNGLEKELAKFKPLLTRFNVRLNATLTAFDAWCSIAKGKEKEASVKAAKAGVYLALVIKEASPDSEEECLVCTSILRTVAEKTGDAEILRAANEILKHFPPPRVNSIQKALVLPK